MTSTNRMFRWAPARLPACVALTMVLGACEGAVNEPQHGNLGSGDGVPGAGRLGGSGASPGTSGSGSGATSSGGAGPGSAAVPYQTRVGRLTHKQYDNTVRDLLFLSGVTPSQQFQPDAVFGGYDNSVDNLVVADRLGRDYRRAAEALAEQAVNDAAAYAKLVTCAPASASCAGSFVETFGRRAYRRPLSAEERQLYVGLHARGAELVASGDAFKDGVRVVIEAMLQSPKFLFRGELTQKAEGEGLLALGDHEIAQRLSYMLWNTMPDEALLDAAERGALADAKGIATQAARLLGDARAEAPVLDFHFQWLDLKRFEDLSRSADLFPNFSPDLPLQEETLAFVRHVGFDLERGYRTLMTAPFSFVDSRLARLYGLSGNFGSELRKADLDPAVRAGILTQIGFLASHAYPSETSPIHRGVFLHRRILCNSIPDPPPGVDTSSGTVENPRTTRDAVSQQTDQDACRGCHSLINPPGFAFENFDAVGQVRSRDRGNPIDTTGQIQLDGERVSFQNAKELVTAIAASNAGRACFARNLLRYAYGRNEAPADQATLDDITSSLADDSYGVKSALLALTRSTAFRLRAPDQDSAQ